MSRVKVNITVSLDGFVAGPSQSEKHPLGIGGEQLHQWLLPLKAFREAHVGESRPRLRQVQAVEAPGVTHICYRRDAGGQAGPTGEGRS